MHRLNQTEIDRVDRIYQKRLQSLQSVDEMIESLVKELDAQGKLNNTYIFYSSDNGYNGVGKGHVAICSTLFMHHWLHRFHLGQHRAFAGKGTNIEEDIR